MTKRSQEQGRQYRGKSASMLILDECASFKNFSKIADGAPEMFIETDIVPVDVKDIQSGDYVTVKADAGDKLDRDSGFVYLISGTGGRLTQPPEEKTHGFVEVGELILVRAVVPPYLFGDVKHAPCAGKVRLDVRKTEFLKVPASYVENMRWLWGDK